MDCCTCGGASLWYNGLTAPFYYEGPARDAIARFKFRQRPKYAEFFAKAMASAVATRQYLPYIDAIVFVPLSTNALRRRGYNQSALLAERIGSLLRKPVLKTALVKTADNLEQHKLNRTDRANNVLGVYRMGACPVSDARLLLIDDISTTGATLNECAKVLRQAGAQSVIAAVIAITRYSK